MKSIDNEFINRSARPLISAEIKLPKEKKLSSVSTHEAEFIRNFLKEGNLNKTLEIGLAHGYSASYIISATNKPHVAIDPFQQKKWLNNQGMKNIEGLGYKDKLVFMEEYSHNALPKLLKNEKRFNFIFIDGGHKFDQIFIDWYYSDLLTEKGGYILFHDSWMQSTQMVAQFVRKNRKDYKEIKTPIKNLILFQKVGEDNRSWYHFKNFFTLNISLGQAKYKLGIRPKSKK